MKQSKFFCDTCTKEVTIGSPEFNVTIEINYNETLSFIVCSECLREKTIWQVLEIITPAAPIGFKPNKVTQFRFNSMSAVPTQKVIQP
jgi:hypothetical protein